MSSAVTFGLMTVPELVVLMISDLHEIVLIGRILSAFVMMLQTMQEKKRPFGFLLLVDCLMACA